MYTNFFGLSDIPFSIAPNPHYLFMSDRHREALAHLTHGLGDTGGFVLLTGEVGTGKTTISRCLLEQLPKNTQVAFILNPTLSCLELLATICDELKVRYKKTGATLKYLTDKIQDKLLKNQADNINTILIIDEAQHLQPEVLEQLRLLTNLETNTKKLLQVILIGQPELQQLLQRRDLRQLAQRITARYHLLPLTKSETMQYIKHRVGVADCHRSLFNEQAVNVVHHISQGIPRIINLLCDRALAIAYGENQSKVNKSIIIQAAEQALGPEFQYQPWWRQRTAQYMFVGLLVLLIAFAGFWLGQNQYSKKDITQTAQQVKINNQALLAENDELDTVNGELIHESEPTKEAEEKTINLNALTPKETEQVAVIAPDDIANAKTEERNLAEVFVEQAESPVQHVISSEPKPPVKFDSSKVAGAPSSLLEKFQSAVEASNQDVESELKPNEINKSFDEVNIRRLSDMPVSFQNAIPRLQFDMHIYASDGDGFVKVNGRERYEGDNISDGIKLVRILPQKVILVYQGEQFSLPALVSW